MRKADKWEQVTQPLESGPLGDAESIGVRSWEDVFYEAQVYGPIDRQIVGMIREHET